MGALIVKYAVGALIVIVLFVGYYINKSNKEDMVRLKQAEVEQKQRLEQNKIDEINSQKRIEAERVQADKNIVSNNEEKQSQISNSEGSKHKYSEEEWLSICKSTAGGAKSIMTSRQRGVSMVDMMDKVVGPADPAIKEIIKAFVIDAYNKPRYDTPEVQQKEILDFENAAYLTCVKIRQ